MSGFRRMFGSDASVLATLQVAGREVAGRQFDIRNPEYGATLDASQTADTRTAAIQAAIDAAGLVNLGEQAALDLGGVGTNIDTVIEALERGHAGNTITITFVDGDSEDTGTWDESGYPDLVFSFKDGVTTVDDFEAAIAGSAYIQVQTPGTGASLLVTSDDEFTEEALSGGREDGPGGSVYIPDGVWLVSRDGATDHCLLGVERVTLEFQSRDAVLKLADGEGGGTLYMIDLNGVDNFHVVNGTVDGNRDALTAPDEQTHCVLGQQSSNCSFTNTRFSNAYGDGAKLQGGLGVEVEGWLFDTCEFVNLGRSGIAIQAGVGGLMVRNCWFHHISDQHVDMEPSGSPAPERITIIGCKFDRRGDAPGFVITPSGFNSPGRGIVIKGCQIYGGCILGISVSDLLIEGNHIETYRDDSEDSAIAINQAGSGVRIIGNTVVVRNSWYGISFTSNANSEQWEGEISSNVVRMLSAAPAAISLNSANRMLVKRNVLVGTGVIPTGIYSVNGLVVPLEGHRYVDNTIKNFHVQIHIGGGAALTKYSVYGNTLDFDMEAWTGDTVYEVDKIVTNDGKSYICITKGTSAGSGGPDTTDDDIADGTAHWAHLGTTSTLPAGLFIDSAGMSEFHVGVNHFGTGGIAEARRYLQLDFAYPIIIGGLGFPEVSHYYGSADPSAGGGVEAAVGSLYTRTDGTLWLKVGATDTDWEVVTTS